LILFMQDHRHWDVPKKESKLWNWLKNQGCQWGSTKMELRRTITLHILGTTKFSSMSVELKGPSPIVNMTSPIVNMTFRLIVNVNVNL
jgi:hypothetical protein